MKKLILVSSLSLFIVGTVYATDPVEVFDKKAAVAEVKMITKAFGGALQKELKGAMQAGGPLNALQVCNIEALPITTKISEDKNASVSRVSLKNRNPDNVPDDWEKIILEDFDDRAAKGEDVTEMGFAEVIEKDGKNGIRFMKALPTGGVCLTCHGEGVSGELKAKLDELYPDDKATGYKLGEVRGAIVVEKYFN